ncbi:MAG: PD40 domain-containing protein [Flavobacteriaceae bacterium]|nr:PD40 domain-containing protein [Flavobacteriaceae bacterium]
MNKILKYRQEVFLVILILFTVSVNSQNSNTVASKKDFLFSYLSSLDFSKGAVKLEPKLISTNQIEYNTSFDVPSQTLYYTISSSDWSQSNIMQSQFQNGKFSKPEKVKFDGQFYNCADVHIQKEGQYLYFVGDEGDIWRSKRKDNQWSKPEKLPEVINSKAPEAYPITTNSGNLYFSRASRTSSYDIYVAKFKNGKYEEAIKLPNTINSNLLESDAWVAPDESFMIFARKDDPNGFGVTDLFISFNTDGQWTKAKNLGRKYNSVGVDGSPWLTPDYKYLFFTSTRNSPNPQQFDGGLDLYVTKFNLNELK